jgi:hypothetical protein
VKSLDFFQIKEMPETSSLLSMCFSEIQAIGILASLLVGPVEREKFVGAISERLLTFKNLFIIAESQFQAKLNSHPIPILHDPFISYSIPANATILGGYFNLNENIKASEITASYLGAWDHLKYGRLVKAALWYIKSRENFKDGFNYLLDLFDAGYIIDIDQFIRAVFILMDTYAKIDDPFNTVMEINLSIDQETTGPMLNAIENATANKGFNEQRIIDIYSLILGRVLDEITKAKDSKCIGEFMLSCGKFSGKYRLLGAFLAKNEPTLRLTISDKAILSYLEEIHGDLFAEIGMLRITPRHFPIVHESLTSAFSLANKYVKVYGDNGIEKLFEDRLLVPRVLQESFRQTFDKTKSSADMGRVFKLPEEWKYFPLTFVSSLSYIKNIEPSMMRSKLLDKHLLLTEVLNSHFKGSLSYNDIRYIIDINYGMIPNTMTEENAEEQQANDAKQYIKNHFYEIYHTTCTKELAALLPFIYENEHLTSEQLITLSKIYPWNSLIYLAMCMDSDKLDNHVGVLENINAAILLEPTNPRLWNSCQAFCSRYSTQSDAEFAAIMEEWIYLPQHYKVSSQKVGSG